MSHAALGFIGAGNMAEAIARGILRAGIYKAGELLAADPSEQRRELFTKDLGIRCITDSATVAAECDVLLLGVKPQMMAAMLEQIKGQLQPQTLVVSIAAAMTSGFIEKSLGADAGRKIRVIRVMPNTPMLVGAGMTALAKGTWAADEDMMRAEKIFAAGGKTVRVGEDLMNAITALSGSGPAYVFYLAEAMAAAGVKLGLTEADAAVLARQTVIGAARLLEDSKDSPAELRRKVTSPGGTTQVAITSLEAGGFMELLAKALAAAEQRGKELSK